MRATPAHAIALAIAFTAAWTAPAAHAQSTDESTPSVEAEAEPTPVEPSLSSTTASAPAAEPPAEAPTDGPAELARQQALAAKAFYDAGNYAEAEEAFRAAYEAAPTPALAYNIARCHERMSQWPDAVRWYETFLEIETDPKERADVSDKLTLLRSRIDGAEEGEDPFEARMLSGRRAYGRGDFEGAIEDFQAAFDIEPKPAAVYNVAKSYEKMARYQDALVYYARYLELAPDATDRADVERIMGRLRDDLKSRFQELVVASNPPGADVYLDDRNDGMIGQTNLHAKLKPGPHVLFVVLNGYEPIKRAFIMPEDKPLSLDFSLEELENVGYVSIDVDQPGARIFIDGAIVGLSPYAQKKALEAGEHQVQVELSGYDRFAQPFTVQRDADTALDIQLKVYDPPVAEGTLSDWGRNLIVFGLIGGGLGFGGPILYQEFILDKPYFESVGPSNGAGRPFYDGSAASLRSNDELETLETVQMVSLIAGGTLIVTGFGVYMYKWLRDTPPPRPNTASNGADWGIEITGVGVSPTADGGAGFGLSGRF